MLPSRVVKSLTGLSSSQLKKLTATFAAAWIDADVDNGLWANPNRPGRPRIYPMRHILVFVLAYLKTNDSYDALAMMFGAKRSTFFSLVKRGLTVLEVALSKAGAMPLRDVESAIAILAKLRGKKRLFIDATERPIRRPKKGQKLYYSGKKKRHTVKNQILSTSDKKILVVSTTDAGSKHDFQIFKEQNLMNNLPDAVPVYVDLGYQGIRDTCTGNKFMIPTKKPYMRELTASQKKETRAFHRCA